MYLQDLFQLLTGLMLNVTLLGEECVHCLNTSCASVNCVFVFVSLIMLLYSEFVIHC
jgi:hypothetical protein